MKAMILAAGVGSRLRPLTDETPKALLAIGGVTMLEHVAGRLIRAGATELIVNAHHHADKLIRFIKDKKNFGISVEISREDVLLDTGGGLKKAAWFFSDGQPFLLHNVDVVSNIDLKAFCRAHIERGALATLAVQDRVSSRALMFHRDGRLCGHDDNGRFEWAGEPVDDALRLPFSGIHAISPALLSELRDEGPFSITRAYLRLAVAGEKILAYRCDDCYWADVGSPEALEAVRQRAAEKGLPV